MLHECCDIVEDPGRPSAKRCRTCGAAWTGDAWPTACADPPSRLERAVRLVAFAGAAFATLVFFACAAAILLGWRIPG